jgi:hypothetical protein
MSNSMQKRKKENKTKRACEIQYLKVVVELVKQQGYGSISLIFLPSGHRFEPVAVVVRKSDATKKRLYQLALWCGCGDRLIFSGSSYDSNQTFHSG